MDKYPPPPLEKLDQVKNKGTTFILVLTAITVALSIYLAKEQTKTFCYEGVEYFKGTNTPVINYNETLNCEKSDTIPRTK